MKPTSIDVIAISIHLHLKQPCCVSLHLLFTKAVSRVLSQCLCTSFNCSILEYTTEFLSLLRYHGVNVSFVVDGCFF